MSNNLCLQRSSNNSQQYSFVKTLQKSIYNMLPDVVIIKWVRICELIRSTGYSSWVKFEKMIFLIL